MGTLFEKNLNPLGCSYIDKDIQLYLIERGFESDFMSPKFLDGIYYDGLTLDKQCLKYIGYINNDSAILTIYINNIDIYYEVETAWGSYKTSSRYDAEDYSTVEDIDSLLDTIMSMVLD